MAASRVTARVDATSTTIYVAPARNKFLAGFHSVLLFATLSMGAFMLVTFARANRLELWLALPALFVAGMGMNFFLLVRENLKGEQVLQVSAAEICLTRKFFPSANGVRTLRNESGAFVVWRSTRRGSEPPDVEFGLLGEWFLGVLDTSRRTPLLECLIKSDVRHAAQALRDAGCTIENIGKLDFWET